MTEMVDDQPVATLDRLALLVSHLFNPALVACWVFAALILRDGGNWKAGLVGLVFYALVPGLSLVLLYRNGFVKDLYPPERSQRGHLLLLGSACYLLGFAALGAAGASMSMLGAGCSFFCNALIVWCINRHWKISIHAVGVAGGILILLFAFGLWLWPLTLALPAVGWARLRLHSHSPAQVVAGTVLGGLMSALVFGLFAG